MQSMPPVCIHCCWPSVARRYTPYAKPGRPQELLTQASAILGQGQLSLAKYLWITETSRGNDGGVALDIHDVQAFFTYMLAGVDWTRDLHFHTRTTIDTLDYSGEGLNAGSKLVVAATGPCAARRTLPTEIGSHLQLPSTWRNPRLAMPGVLCIESDSVREPASYASRQWQREYATHCPSITRFAATLLSCWWMIRRWLRRILATSRGSHSLAAIRPLTFMGSVQTIDKHFSVFRQPGNRCPH